jgi:hypothetical protein
LFFEDGKHAPIFRIPAPTGAIERRTFERGSEMHLTLNIPNPDPQRELDAVRFSPGEGAPPVLFPIKEGVKDKAFFRASYIEAHRGDSRVEAIIAEGYRMRAEFHAMEEKNRGLTYEP